MLHRLIHKLLGNRYCTCPNAKMARNRELRRRRGKTLPRRR